jgi:16S rRNA processing protein RimM
LNPLELGTLAKAHGLRGELKVTLYWSESEALRVGSRVVLRSASQQGTFEVRSLRGSGRKRVIGFSGIEDRDAAERWQGAVLLVERGELPPLGAGEYYLADLVGAEVFAPDGRVGRVSRVTLHPSVDVLVIEAEDGSEQELPLLDHWLSEVDVEGRRIVLTSRDGLL